MTNAENGANWLPAHLLPVPFHNELIRTDPAALVPMPKLHDKELVRLDPNEVAILLDQVERARK